MSNGEHPVTEVRGADGRRRNTVPLDVIPERGQVPENLSPDGSIVESKDVRHVLHEHVAGSKLANGSGHLSPQNGLRMVEPVLLAGGADALAGEASGDELDSLGRSSANCPDVIEDGHPGPTLLEDAAPPRVDLAEPGVLDAGEVQAVGEQADSVEESTGDHRPSSRVCFLARTSASRLMLPPCWRAASARS